MSDISPEALDWLEAVIDRKIQNAVNLVGNSQTRHRSTVLSTDTNDVTWVSIPGVVEKIPVAEKFTEISDGDVVYVTIENGMAFIEWNASSPAATSDSVSDAVYSSMLPVYTSIDSLNLKHLDLESITAETADFVNASIENLKAEKADIDFANIVELFAGHVTTDRLDAIRANITKLVSEAAIFESLKAEYGEIGDLRSRFADITFANVLELDANNAHINQASIDQLVAAAGMFDTIRSERGTVENLNSHFAEIDLANVSTLFAGGLTAEELEAVRANITTLITESAYITDTLVGTEGAFTKYLTGVTINGDLIKANTIIADRILYPGADGMYYMLNYHGGFTRVVPTMDMDPEASGLYELNEDGVYVLTTDDNAYMYQEVMPPNDSDPSFLGYYELVSGLYVLTQDTTLYEHYRVNVEEEDDPSALFYEEATVTGYVSSSDVTTSPYKAYYFIDPPTYSAVDDVQTGYSEMDPSSEGWYDIVHPKGLSQDVYVEDGKDYYTVDPPTYTEVDNSQAGYSEFDPSSGWYEYRQDLVSSTDVAPVFGKEYYEADAATYSAVDDTQAGYSESNPGSFGWFEVTYIHSLTSDNSPMQGKTYYVADQLTYSEIDDAQEGYSSMSPLFLGWYEIENSITITSDTEILEGKTYLIEVPPGYAYIDPSDEEDYYDLNPSALSWYEFVDGEYVITEDTEIVPIPGFKDYYRPTSATYSEISAHDLEGYSGSNPSEEGWYEYVSSYVLSDDDSVEEGKSYYEMDARTYTLADPEQIGYSELDPSDEGWYELQEDGYVATSDSEPVTGKTYYAEDPITYSVVDDSQEWYPGANPSDMGWKEYVDVYFPSSDSEVSQEKTYYSMDPFSYTLVDSSQEGYLLLDPSYLGWYEVVDDYVPTEDSQVSQEKTYYVRDSRTYTFVGQDAAGSPVLMGWYEPVVSSYTVTSDESPVDGKPYYGLRRSSKVYYERVLTDKAYFVKTDDEDLPLEMTQYHSALDGSRIVAHSITANEINVENLTATGSSFMNILQTRLLEADKVRIGPNHSMHIMISRMGNVAELGFYNGNDTKYVEVEDPASNPSASGYYDGTPVSYVEVDSNMYGYSEKDPSSERWLELVDGEYVLTEDASPSQSKTYYKVGEYSYSLTTDESPQEGKVYYVEARDEVNRVAYIDGNRLMIPYSVVLKQMLLGDWAWTYRLNGNMDLIYIGTEE